MKITEIKFHKISNEDTEVIARVDIHFDWFWLKGFKLIRNTTTNKEFVTPPSYRSSKGWRALFSTDEEQDWQRIFASVLSAYSEHLMKESADQINEYKPYK